MNLPGSQSENSESFRKKLRGFALILVQLGLLVWVFKTFHLETPAFFEAAILTFATFGLHFWLPKRWKEPLFFAVSAAAAFWFFSSDLRSPLVFVGAGLVQTALFASTLPRHVKLLSFAVSVGAAAWCRAVSETPWISEAVTLFGTVFGIRGLIFAYDLRGMKTPPSFTATGAYFFMLPNWVFLFFPVVDWQTMRKGFSRRPALELAQSGVVLILRGTVQLLLYRLVYHLKGPATPDQVTSLLDLVRILVLTYLLYLRVSGTFHIAVGFLHLLGYDLPETHRNYLLAENFTDFWRRINIYWKDFMVKLFWMPVYFRLKRTGDLQAQLVATAVVFLATWFLHGMVFFWLMGRFHFSTPDALFWGILAVLVMLRQARDAKRGTAVPRLSRLQRSVHVALTFVTTTLLWTLWESPSLSAFIDLLTYWRVGG